VPVQKTRLIIKKKPGFVGKREEAKSTWVHEKKSKGKP